MTSASHSNESTYHTSQGYSKNLYPAKFSPGDSLDQPAQSFEYYANQLNHDEPIIDDNFSSPKNTLKKGLLKNQYTLLKIKPCSGEFSDDETSLDKGWLKVYQIWLALFVVSLVGYGLYSLISVVNSQQSLNLRYIIFTFYLFFFVIIELQAILQRDLNKAKYAVWGFKGFMATFFIVQLVFVISYSKTSFRYFMELIFGLSSFYLSVFLGANKVFSILQNA